MSRVLAGLAVVVLLALPAVAAADPTPTPTVTAAGPEAPLRITVTELLPRAPKAHGAVEVVGVLKNLGSSPISGITVRLRVGSVIQYRGDLHDADTDRPLTTQRQASTAKPERSDLPAGASIRFDLHTTADELGLSKLGVYPVDVEARGDAGDGIESLGLAPTWLPFFPEKPRPIRIAVALPLVDLPHQRTDATLHDDDLSVRLAHNGRLEALLAAGRGAAIGSCDRGAVGPALPPTADPAMTRCEPVPVTLAVDPDLLVAAVTMSKPYKVKDGHNSSGSGTAAAAAWVGALKTAATTTTEVLALPYADPDVTALTRTAGGRDDVALASVLGRSTVSALLGTSPIDGVAWPPAGPVSQAAADALARNGARAFVLDESAYGQPDSPPNRDPSARTVLASSATGAELDGLVSDSYLSNLVLGPDPTGLGPRLAEQRFLAETAILTAEAPSATRTFVIAPDRRSVVSAGALTESLRDLGRVPWLCPVTLSSVAAGDEDCALHPGVGSTPAEDRGQPRTDPSGQLSVSFLSGIADDRDAVEQLTSAILSDKQDPTVRDAVSAIKQRLRQAVARAESSAWRTDAGQGRVTALALHEEVKRLEDKIVVRGGRALLTSSKGTLQVSIENTLDIPVDVRVRFSSKTATLSAATTGLVEVTPGHAVQAGVKAEAQRSGQFVVFAQILDRNGKAFGPETEIIVRSTRFGRLALAVTAGGFGVLLIAAGVRIVRRAVRSRS